MEQLAAQVLHECPQCFGTVLDPNDRQYAEKDALIQYWQAWRSSQTLQVRIVSQCFWVGTRSPPNFLRCSVCVCVSLMDLVKNSSRCVLGRCQFWVGSRSLPKSEVTGEA